MIIFLFRQHLMSLLLGELFVFTVKSFIPDVNALFLFLQNRLVRDPLPRLAMGCQRVRIDSTSSS